MWNWQWSVPNLVLFGLLCGVLWYKLHLLRVTIATTIAEQIAERWAPAPAPVGQQFVEEGFEQIRQDIRELTARVEHVESLLGANGNG